MPPVGRCEADEDDLNEWLKQCYAETARRHRPKKPLTIVVVVLAIIIGVGSAQLVKAETVDGRRIVIIDGELGECSYRGDGRYG